MKLGYFVIAVAVLSWIAGIRVEAGVDWFVQSASGTTILSGSASSGAAFTISVSGLSGGPARTIWVKGGSSDDIGRITVSGTVTSAPEIKLHVDTLSGPPTSMYTSTANAAGVNWAGVVHSYNGALRVSACVSGNLTDTFGGNAVLVDYIFIGGAIQSAISGNAGEFWVHAASVASGAHITCSTGTLASLEVSAGNLLANVKSLTGGIGSIQVDGNIGTTSFSPDIWTATNIGLISGESVYANIFPGAYTPFTGTLDQLITTGDLGGTARTSGFTTMSIGGSLVGELALKGAGPFPSGKTITIGYSLASTGTISVSTAAALGGQVIINKDNIGGTWASGGEVVVGSSGGSPVTLTGPTYPTLSSQLGGGAVGLAGFNLHVQDSEPPDVFNVIGETMTLRHYGPVFWTSDAPPVTIWYRLAGTQDPWTNITDDFEVYAGATAREVVIETLTSLDFDALIEYRVTPIRSGTNMLKCVGVGNGSVPVADYEWIIGP